jgi:hypothetical protein
MKSASFAPLYCGLYPELAELCRKHGYALAIHGSLQRDFDLICIPWVEMPSTPEQVVDAIVSEFAIRKTGKPDITFHGRIRYSLPISFGECFLDLQFMPCQVPA